MAIDSADRNPHRTGRVRRWHGRTRRVGLGACALLGLSTLGGLSGCSKGGAPDLTGCAKLADLVPGDSVVAPMNTTYAILKSPSGALIPVSLDPGGSGTHTFNQCDQQDTYTVSKVVLLDKNNNVVATANGLGGPAYSVTYPGGRVVTGLSFPGNVTTYSDPAAGPAATLTDLKLSAATPGQGDPITVTATMTGDPCGIRESQWWLASSLTGTAMVTAPQSIPGGSGSATLRVPPTAGAMSQLYVAGQVTLSSGRILQIHQATSGDPNYTIYDSNGKAYAAPLIPKVAALSVTVMPKADVDKTAPQVLSIEATPMSAVRCGTVNLTLHLKDDQPLPAGQQVKVWLGQANAPRLFSTTVVGSEYLSGKVQLPVDAPSGVWYAWPEIIRDAAGNEAKANPTPDGKFTLTPAPADPMAQSIAAGMFTVPSNGVELPDGAGPPVDLGMVVDLAGQPDMATPLPAVLNNILVMPGTPKPSEAVTIYATWTQSSGSP